METRTQVINALRDFLKNKGVLEEFCEALPHGNVCSLNQHTINSFSWYDACARQGNKIPWSEISTAWWQHYQKLGCTYNKILTKEQRDLLIKELRGSRTSKILRAVLRMNNE